MRPYCTSGVSGESEVDSDRWDIEAWEGRIEQRLRDARGAGPTVVLWVNAAVDLVADLLYYFFPSSVPERLVNVAPTGVACGMDDVSLGRVSCQVD
ncbi:hypothetical protein CYMTET_10769 [Cymbomonas tetramitiformis]|uniref:Uncharacterized protein n=1 Tax=Cymbomonas tetramitiformis TaxID=36881 RepID=A0AAE0GNR2_9CHLO|nr:hypothetical protein CYMTET_10769 [Cymbomonas tetramitiformis]